MQCIFHENFREIDSIIVSELLMKHSEARDSSWPGGVEPNKVNREWRMKTEILQHTSVLGVQRFPAH